MDKVKKAFLKYYTGLILFFFLGLPFTAFSQVDDDFWFVVPELSHRGNTGGTPGLFRIATMELEATVTISMPANSYDPITNPTGFQDIVVYIPPSSAVEVDLTHLIDVAADPTNNRLENKPLTPTGINNFGLHITSTNMITLYWEVVYDLGADLWTLKGTNGIGTLFYTPFQTQYENRAMIPRAYSAIDVVATQDNTQVTFTLPPGKAASYGSLATPVAAGGTLTINLNRGQTFSLFPLNYSVFPADRLAGTKIESTNPIAVTLKDDALRSGSQGQDLVGDQIVPVDILGDNHVVPEISNPNYVYVVASEDNTNIYVYNAAGAPIGASPYATLNAGEQVEVFVPGGSQYARITSRLNPLQPFKPIYVFQMGLENQCRGGALVPPIGCTGNTQLAFTRAGTDQKFYFYLITEVGNEDKFIIDTTPQLGAGDIIDPGAFTEILGSDGWTVLFTNSINPSKLPSGQHLIKNTGGIFHLGILNGFPGAVSGALYYGYYSDFGGLNIGATVAGTNSDFVRACYGDPVQLYAFGGTTYLWSPDTYLDDATSNMPTAINLPPGPYLYNVEVSGACGTDDIDLTVVVAQPVVAFFQTDTSSGCSPLEVTFTDQSSGEFSWQYDFGDGSPLQRYDLDPLTGVPEPPGYPADFSFPHTYTNTSDTIIERTVTLLVKNESGCADFFSKTIVIFPEIHSDFTVDVDEGCDPLLVNFQNTSYGDTAYWEWEFGDGGSSIDENPSHTFRNLFGPDNLVFETQLIAISPYFCRDTSTHQITVRPYIEANFAFDTVAACSPHEFIITDQSFGADTYYWDFGDGGTGTSPGPQITRTYTNPTGAPVTYTISLRVENEEGCWDTLSRQFVVYPEITADFTAVPVEECSPFEVVFQNTSTDPTGAATYFWDFGDGGTSVEEHPIHLYDRNMMDHDTVYTVTLIATTPEFCRDTTTLDITVHPYIKAAFTVDDIIGCHPFTITIENQAIGAEAYLWDFGDGSPVSTTSDSTFQHTYLNTTGSTVIYPLQQVVLNTEGCSDTLIRYITVYPELTADFTADVVEGCHPLTVTFTDQSLNAVTYYWEFGDGVSSVEQSPIHTFNNFGSIDTTYTVILTTSSADGECFKTDTLSILVHPYVEAEFTFLESLDCTPFEVTFENLSIGGVTYYWDFGDGTDTITTTLDPVTHSFVNADFVNIQHFEVILLVENAAGCTSEIRRTVSVYPDIQTSFTASVTEGCHPLDVDFTNLTQGGQTYVWDFGDGSSSFLQDPTHHFTNTGTIDSIYTVTLVSIASNNACRDTFTMDITVHPYILASFTVADNIGCNPFDVLIENSSVNGTIFRWDFGDGTDTITYNTDAFVHQFTNSDFVNQQDYVITLEAENAEGCTSQISRSITVEPDIEAEFSASQVQGCHPLVVDFTNLSNGAAYYLWDFGNRTTSDLVNPSQTFTNIGATDSTYHVWLYATAPNNECTDSFMIDIVVHPYIHADFTFLEYIQCTPSMVTFHNASIGGDTFYWDFGDGTDTTTTTMDSVVHVFNNTSFINYGNYLVTLTAENYAGCTSQISRTVEVYPAIEAAFSMSFDEGCHPLEVDFSNLSSGGYTYLWDFGDGATSKADAPTHTFTNFSDTSITRQIRLVATSQFNCTSEITAEVTIYPKPVARFETDGIIDCALFDVGIINTSLKADVYAWSFGDGDILGTASTDTIHHIYDNLTDNIAEYNLKLTASTTYGCTDSTQQKIYVYPRAIADFSSNNEGCSPLAVYFTNESVRGETYLWDFGDGSTTRNSDPTNIYFNYTGVDTIYRVTLTTTTQFGCVDSISYNIDVYAQPQAEFIASPGSQIYPDATVNYTNLTNDGAWTYLWEMGDGFSTTLEDAQPHTYPTWGDYKITLHASSPHCVDSVSHTIHILPGPPVAGIDTVIPGCEPLTVAFVNSSNYGYEYYWDFGDGFSSTEQEPTHTYTEAGAYQVTLRVTGDGGVDYAYERVEVWPNPSVYFIVEPTLVMLPDQPIKLYNLTEYGDQYLWDFGDGVTSTEEEPIYQYTDVGTYDITLTAWTIHDCVDTLTLPDAVTVEGEGYIYYPNAFFPNQEESSGGHYSLTSVANDIFRPYHKGVDKYILQIYSRWGELLFTSNDVMIGWDGYFEGELCKQDVYVFKAFGNFYNGKPFYVTGDVTLLLRY